MPSDKELTDAIVNRAMGRIRDHKPAPSPEILDERAVSEIEVVNWKKGFPDLDGDYYCRVDEYDKQPTLIRIESRTSSSLAAVYEFGCGDDLRREYEAEEDYEYLGPLTPVSIPALCATVKDLRRERDEAIKARDLYVSLKRGQQERADEIEARALELLQERDDLQSQLEQLRAENGRLEKVIALWFGPNSCSVCGGAPLASGKPCVCGGKGTMQAEHEGLRQALYDADISGTKIQQERDSLRGTLSALNNCRNKPVCGHCNALLREAESQYQGK